MKDIILDLCSKYPKNYIAKIKNDNAIYEWVLQHSKASGDHFPTHVYSAVHGISNICPNGNLKYLDRWSSGLKMCGIASKCECTRASIAKNVKIVKSSYNEDKLAIINQKREKTMIDKFGCAYNSQRPDVKSALQKSTLPLEIVEKLRDYEWMHAEYVIKARNSVDIASDLKVHYTTVLEYCRKHGFTIRQNTNYSKEEREIADYVESLGVIVERNNWDILTNREIDVYIPEKKLAIELNGLYWHSYHPSTEKSENKYRHLEKKNLCSENNIQLLQFTDHEWHNKQDIVKSIIHTKLGLNGRIYARKCVVESISSKVARQFHDDNHLHGFMSASHHVGLFFNGELVSVMSVGVDRFNKSSDYELIRLSTAKFMTVVGGASKLLKYCNVKLGINRLITYCHKTISTGQGYKKLGFIQKKDTVPGYCWTDGHKVISRFNTQKHKLSKLLSAFDPLLSEDQNMYANGYRKFYDCGNYVFEKYLG